MENENKKGFERLDKIYMRRDDYAKDMKKEGRKIIGYLCYFAPPELISTAGMIPYRIMGKMGESTGEADAYVEQLGCPLIRNCFEQDLKGAYDFLDGRIIPHSCDSAQRLYGIWKYYKGPSYNYLFNVPHMVTPYSSDFFKRELTFFKESLEKYAGCTITEDKLMKTIELYNENRRIVQELYDLRKKSSPSLSGTDMLKALIVGMSIPPEEFNVFLKELRDEARSRQVSTKDTPRILFWGCILDDIRLHQLIEDAGAVIVTDDTCIGTRSYLRQVDTSNGVMEELTKAYFEEFMCPRTSRGPGMGRFDYVMDLVRDYNVHGVVGYSLSFCDPHKFDYPDLRDYLNQNGMPMLLIDDDYTLSNAESIRSRVEAFLEML